MTLTFPPAIKNILVAIGMTMSRAHKSGCNNTSNEGSHTIPKNGTNHSDVFQRKFLYFVQKAATESMIESFKNSVGCREKGIPGTSNHPRAPLILTPITSTSINNIMTMMLIAFTFFFHQRYGIFIAKTIAVSPMPACNIFLSIKRQLFGASMLHASTSLFVILYESYTLTELIITDQNSTRKSTRNKRG